MKRSYYSLLPIIPALMTYALLAHSFNFIQDDAYISYRYVANYLNGDGLVYNIGEGVEGFTNFGWVVFLLFCGTLGLKYILISKVTGFACGAGFIIITWLTARRIFADKGSLYVWLPVYLVGVNLSLAYWSPAGLETAAFAFLAMLSLYLYMRRSWWLILAFLLAVWVRPEGVLVAGMLLIIEAATERRWPLFALKCVMSAFVLSLPLAIFKLTYYGSIFPNPFFAKTGLHLDQLLNGLEYAGRFFSHYGFYGLGVVLPLFQFRKLSAEVRSVWLYTVLYALYVVLVGGDTLKVHRFFIPLLGTSALLLTVSLQSYSRKLKPIIRNLVFIVVAVPLLFLTYRLPLDFVTTYNSSEKNFTGKMRSLARQMRQDDPTNFSVALSTIGVFGYELLGHNIIDMVGLTDSTIARHSEEPVPGMETTWKERRHNSRYLLTLAPDYIVFSTGAKPSAPAERALLLFPQFLESYRTVGWFCRADESKPQGAIALAFKRVREITGKLEPTYPIEYVQHYKTGMDHCAAGAHVRAIECFDKALEASPKPCNPYITYYKAFSYIMLDRHERAIPLLEELLAADSLIFEAHKDLYIYAVLLRDSTKMEIHKRWLKKLVPWYWPRIERNAAQTAVATRVASPKR